MKVGEDNCWYNGRHEFCKATYPGQYEICSATYHRCVECTDNDHCPPERPWCDWDLSCEECLISDHCSADESCLMRNGHWVCRAKGCVDYREEGDYDYCANNFRDRPICDINKRRCVECVLPSDCEGGKETCIDSVCVDESEMDCVQQIDAGFLNYCEVTFPERPVCHTRLRDCVECQFDFQCDERVGKEKEYACSGTRCMKKEWECKGPEDCISNDYKCVKHECVKKDCSDYDDPDAFCEDRRGDLGWRCLDKICVRCIEPEDCHNVHKKCVHNKCVDIHKKDECTEPDYPKQFCVREYGTGWYCKGGQCVYKEPKMKLPPVDCRDYRLPGAADEYCAGYDPEKPHCDVTTGRCQECNFDEDCPAHEECKMHKCRECSRDRDCDRDYECSGAPDWECIREICTNQEWPNDWCRHKYGVLFSCVADECKVVDCDGTDSACPEGFYCPDRVCVWGCRVGGSNCPEAKPFCSPEGTCVECVEPVDCGLGSTCENYACVEEEDCMHLDSLCPENEYCVVHHCEEGCRDSRNCAKETPHCSQHTGKCEICVFDQHCERGYDCDDYKCVWVGYDCTIDPECPANWFCNGQHFCVFGCNRSDDNCAKETPYCSRHTGKCEECWSSVQCEEGTYQECDNYRCVAKKGYEDCVEGDTKHGKRCREGLWIVIECKGPEDCLGHEYCDDGLCMDKEHGCEVPSDCPSGYYCDLHSSKREFHKCEEQVCSTHEDCPVGMGCDIGTFNWNKRANVETSCLSWREYYCSEKDPCPEEWVCDKVSGKCVEALCGEGRPCQDGRYKCEDGLCIPKRCDDYPDPRQQCIDELGWYGRCVNGACVVLDCSWYPDPTLMCQETKGENWMCEEKRCIDLGAESGNDPRDYCSKILGVDEAYWDFEERECTVPDCNTVNDPDKMCAQLKNPSYRCREGECRHGREGEECENRAECVTGLRCAGGLCIEKECIRWQDCNDPEKWCNHGVCEPLRTECDGPKDCRDDYHCDAGGQCIPNDCDDHYDCGEGECCAGNRMCIRCELMTCFYNFNCRRGWSCNLKTNKCTRVNCTVDSKCEEGYYCDLDSGTCRKMELGEECWDDPDCPEGQVCKGARGAKWVQGKGGPWDLIGKFGSIQKKHPGICVDKGTRVIRIEGIDDERTCDYCRNMMGRVVEEGGKLPPYHKSCRCYGVYED